MYYYFVFLFYWKSRNVWFSISYNKTMIKRYIAFQFPVQQRCVCKVWSHSTLTYCTSNYYIKMRHREMHFSRYLPHKDWGTHWHSPFVSSLVGTRSEDSSSTAPLIPESWGQSTTSSDSVAVEMPWLTQGARWEPWRTPHMFHVLLRPQWTMLRKRLS